MLNTILLVGAMVLGQHTPNDSFNTAYADLVKNVPVDQRYVTRYLDETGVVPSPAEIAYQVQSDVTIPANQKEAAKATRRVAAAKEKADFERSLLMTLNSLSWRPQLVKSLHHVTDTIVRINLTDLGWDSGFRTSRFNLMQKFGVRSLVTDNKFLDIWETFAAADVYYQTPQVYNYQVYRGWIDPEVELSARNISCSTKFIIRANFLMPRLWVEKGQGGFYSQVLMLPPLEADLYKGMGVPVEFIDKDSTLKAGGAVLESVVALHNRELQLLPSIYGKDNMKFIWRTFDVEKDGDQKDSVLEAFAGTVNFKGREIIGTSPNGTHWYYLCDNKGKQVDFVPQTIAIDMRPGDNIKDRTVYNAYKCLSCHGPVSGTYPFNDAVSKALLTPGIVLGVVGKDKKANAVQRQILEDYYRNLDGAITQQQESYANVIKELNGLAPGVNSENVVGFFDKYTWRLVSPNQAALEMGLPLADAIDYWRYSGNSQLIVLSGGHDIRRAAWEKSFADAMLGARYSWDKTVKAKANVNFAPARPFSRN